MMLTAIALAAVLHAQCDAAITDHGHRVLVLGTPTTWEGERYTVTAHGRTIRGRMDGSAEAEVWLPRPVTAHGVHVTVGGVTCPVIPWH